jgi:hypothetical protein
VRQEFGVVARVGWFGACSGSGAHYGWLASIVAAAQHRFLLRNVTMYVGHPSHAALECPSWPYPRQPTKATSSATVRCTYATGVVADMSTCNYSTPMYRFPTLVGCGKGSVRGGLVPLWFLFHSIPSYWRPTNRSWSSHTVLG